MTTTATATATTTTYSSTGTTSTYTIAAVGLIPSAPILICVGTSIQQQTSRGTKRAHSVEEDPGMSSPTKRSWPDVRRLSSEYQNFINFLIADLASLSTVSLPNYNTWLPEWLHLIALCPTRVHVSQEAWVINTPLSLSAWRSLLDEYLHQELVQFFTTGISNGFRISFSHLKFHLKRAQKNMQSAYVQASGRQIFTRRTIHEQSCWSICSFTGSTQSDKQIWSDSKTSQTRHGG